MDNDPHFAVAIVDTAATVDLAEIPERLGDVVVRVDGGAGSTRVSRMPGKTCSKRR